MIILAAAAAVAVTAVAEAAAVVAAATDGRRANQTIIQMMARRGRRSQFPASHPLACLLGAEFVHQAANRAPSVCAKIDKAEWSQAVAAASARMSSGSA